MCPKLVIRYKRRLNSGADLADGSVVDFDFGRSGSSRLRVKGRWDILCGLNVANGVQVNRVRLRWG